MGKLLKADSHFLIAGGTLHRDIAALGDVLHRVIHDTFVDLDIGDT